MADIALGSVGKIVQIALKIKEAVETVKQNEKECHDIQRCVARVSALLRKLDEMTETMKDEVMRDALEDLAESLERALELVTECQRKHNFRRFLGAGNMAKELGRVQDDIVRKLQLGNFATSVQTITIMGVLQDGQVVAIKRVYDTIDIDGDIRLYDEINVSVDLKHKNITRPLGYCHEVTVVLISHNGKYVGAQQREMCFVAEYMANGSMEMIMNGSRFIDWSCRFKMIQGIAQGLHYLHEQRVVHMDIKPDNILFDSDMNPRINDFGLAKKLDLDEKTSDTLDGTLYYMAPEYMYQGIMSTKCDVYAFGITLLGTIIGSMSMSSSSVSRVPNQWAFEARDDLRMELFKPSLCCKSQLMQIKKCMEIGLLCVEEDREHRPTMADVLAMLNGVKELPALKRPWGIE